MLIRTSDINSLINGNPFAPPIDPGPAPVNTTGTASQITEVIRLYKYYKEKITTYCDFRIILINMITNKCIEKYMTTLKHCITNFCQCELITLLNHLYTYYGTIIYFDLTVNFDSMTACWNPLPPIADLLLYISDGKELV